MTALDTAYTLGRTGLRVTRLALGAMTFGSDWGWGADEAASRALFDRYLDAGGNFVDTADLYCGGESERMLGRFVADAGARDRLVIATKYGYSASLGGAPASANTGGNHRKNLVRAVEGSLARLGTDYIDLLWTHIWDRLTPVDEVARALDDLVRAGKVRYVGLSNAPAWYAARAQTLAELRGWEPIAALQLEYSLVERQLELEHADAAQHLGMGLVAWSPLGSGVLTGKYRPGGAGEGRLAVMKDSGNPVFDKLTPANFAILEVVEAVARELGRTPAQVALNWVATQPGVASVIVGATKLSQLDDNLGALDFALPPELRARLDAVSAPERRSPYVFFEPAMQAMVHGGAGVGDRPDGYHAPVRAAGGGAKVK